MGEHYGKKRTKKLTMSRTNNMGGIEFKNEQENEACKRKTQKEKKQKYHYILAKEKRRLSQRRQKVTLQNFKQKF